MAGGGVVDVDAATWWLGCREQEMVLAHCILVDVDAVVGLRRRRAVVWIKSGVSLIVDAVVVFRSLL